MKLRLLGVFFILVGLCALTAWSQSTASLSGTVTDPSGAVVPNAKVTVHSLATGLDRVVNTDSAGLYVVPSLIPGDYKVQVSASGFSAYVVPKVTLDVDREVTVNMHLAISSAGETVQVQSAVQQIEAQTITVGQVIDNTAVQELPLNGRHFLDLTVLTPGSVVADTAGSLTATSRGLGANSFMTRRQSRRLDQLPDQRHQSERHQPEPDHLSAVDQHHVGVQDRQLHLQRGIRPQRRLHRDRCHPLRHRPIPRRGLRLLPQRGAGRALAISIAPTTSLPGCRSSATPAIRLR